MNLDEIVTEAIGFRWRAAQRASVERWVRAAYSVIWGAELWPWRVVEPTAVSVTENSDIALASLPADFNRPRTVYDLDNDSDPLENLDVEAFFGQYLEARVDDDTDDPCSWCYTNDTLFLGPKPKSARTMHVGYERKVTSRNAAGVLELGGLLTDTSEPIFDEAYHYMLVPGSLAIGAALHVDPTYQHYQTQFDQLYTPMMHAELPSQIGQNRQYGSIYLDRVASRLR